MNLVVISRVALLLAAGVTGCQGAAAPVDHRTCEERQSQLQEVLARTPKAGLAAAIEVGLPTSSLRSKFGRGAILELSETRWAVDGASISGKTTEERLAALGTLLAKVDRSAPLFVAAAANTTITELQSVLVAIPTELELRLVFSTPPVPVEADPDEPGEEARRLAARVLAERDVGKRNQIADAAYPDYASCQAVQRAAGAVKGLGVKERWPALRESMLSAIPGCACDDIDADGLRYLLVAEQRAGSVSLGTIPGAFLRQERCAAALGSSSVQQLLDDVGEFDEEFAGNWKDDELVFDEVVTDDRLLVYLCVALPDETLAWLQKKRSTVYFRAAGDRACQPWAFAPIAPGSPFGRLKGTSRGEPLTLHYRQGAGSIRVFGPSLDDTSRPTDEGPWGCDETLPLSEVDDRSVRFQDGARWYFTQEACAAAPMTDGAFSGCVANLTLGIAPPPPPLAPAEPAAPVLPGKGK